jgi:hypothetical protein
MYATKSAGAAGQARHQRPRTTVAHEIARLPKQADPPGQRSKVPRR